MAGNISFSVLTNPLVEEITLLDRNNTLLTSNTSSTIANDYALMMFEKIAIPLISIFGLIGNTLAFIVFTRPPLRQSSCSFFLAARSLSDNGFLVSLLVIWLSSVLDLKINATAGVCQTFIFLTYVFGCLSVWLVVLVTAENYVRICKPFLVNKVCKLFNAKALVIIILLIIIGFYSFPFWTMSDACVPQDRQFRYIQGMIYADSLLNFILPIIFMTFLIVAIGTTTLKSYKRRRRLSTASISASKSPITKVAKMLLAVTLIFFFLNIPSHVIRLRLAVQTFVQKDTILTRSDISIHSMSLLLYYVSLAINIIIYYSFGIKFRTVFLQIILCRRPSPYASAQSFCTTNSVVISARRIPSSNPYPPRRMMSDSFLKVKPIPRRKTSSKY